MIIRVLSIIKCNRKWFGDIEECSDTRLDQIKHSHQAGFIIGHLVMNAVVLDTVFGLCLLTAKELALSGENQ